MIHYTHSFPETTWMGTLNKLVTLELAQQFPPGTCIIDGTHLWDFDLVEFAKSNPPHFYVTAFSDPVRLAYHQLDKYFDRGHYTVIAPKDYSFFGRYCYDVFYNNFCGQCFPCSAKYLFMSYNRKPRQHREDLVRSLFRSNLNNEGIITLGDYTDPSRRTKTSLKRSISTAPYSTFTADVNIDPFDNTVKDVPNDITTLGNLDLWEASLVNVVSEVSIQDLFITEKTFKPIIGRRPFLINAASGTLELLKDWGFRTFGDYWDESYDSLNSHLDRIEDITKILQDLSELTFDERLAMYNDMREILTYNHNHFFNEFQKINNRAFNSIGGEFQLNV